MLVLKEIPLLEMRKSYYQSYVEPFSLTFCGNHVVCLLVATVYQDANCVCRSQKFGNPYTRQKKSICLVLCRGASCLNPGLAVRLCPLPSAEGLWERLSSSGFWKIIWPDEEFETGHMCILELPTYIYLYSIYLIVPDITPNRWKFSVTVLQQLFGRQSVPHVNVAIFLRLIYEDYYIHCTTNYI